jgi:SAM-dependent methyltransferase
LTDDPPPKEPCYLRSARSPAFARFCARVYGRSLNQYGTADMAQLDLLVDVLGLRPDDHVLDAGCGTGHTTTYLAEQSGAAFTGMDKAEASVRCATERAAAAPGPPLTFLVGTMDAIDLPTASFDAVIAIESLYFPTDLAATIGQFTRLLRPGGRMGLFYTHFGGAGATADPAGTKLGLALRANALEFQAQDLTDADRRFWQRCADAAAELRSEFEAEGNTDLMHAGETTAVLDLIAKGGHARYLYDVRLAS